MNHTPPSCSPVPIRFAPEDDMLLRRLKALTGISMSSLIRRSVQYAAPRFLDGRINLLTLSDNGGSSLIPKKSQPEGKK